MIDLELLYIDIQDMANVAIDQMRAVDRTAPWKEDTWKDRYEMSLRNLIKKELDIDVEVTVAETHNETGGQPPFSRMAYHFFFDNEEDRLMFQLKYIQ